MSTTTWRARARRTLAAVTTTALVAGAVVVGTGTTALADEPARDVVSGTAQWGVKASFRNYIGGPVAHGEITVTEPATRDGEIFAFEAAEGTVDGTTADIAFAGGVRFSGHAGALDVRLSDITVTVDGTEGTLSADVTSKSLASGDLVEYGVVRLGSIDLSDSPLTVTGDVVSVTGAEVTMTEAGVPAFADFYPAGSELDPISFSVQLEPAAVAPQVTAQPQDVTADEGADAVFTATATGNPEPTVQWQTRAGADAEWQDVAGATTAELTLPAVAAAQHGTQVRAVFSNGTEPDAVTQAAALAVVPAEVPVEWTPAIEVFAADGVTPVGDAELTYGDSVVVKGTGFDPAANVGGRGVPIPADLPQGTYVVFGKFAEQWRPSQGAASAARVVGDQRWALAESVLDQVPGGLQGTVRAQWVELAEDGSFTTTLEIKESTNRDGTVKAWPADGSFGVYTYGAGGMVNADQELAVPLNVVEEPAEPVFEPAIEVFAADGVTPVGDSQVAFGDTVVVKGTGFDPAANVGGRGVPIPADLPQGTYVVFGKFAEQWRPSQDVPSSQRVVGSQRWALAESVLEQVPADYQGVVRRDWVAIDADGSFEARLAITDREAAWPAEGLFGVYTYAAGGVKNADQELSVPLDVVEERTPQLTVTPQEDLTVGTVVTVEGTGYAPNRKLSVAFTANTEQDPEFGWPVGWLHHDVVTTDALGSFTRSVTVADWRTGDWQAGEGADCSEVQCYLATFNSAQASDAVDVDRRAERDQDVFVPVTFVAGQTEPEPETPTLSAEPSEVPQGGTFTLKGTGLPPGPVTAQLESGATPSTGFLDWGVKESFRSYVTGPVAHGEVTVSEDVETNEDGTYRFRATEAAQDEGAGAAVLSFGGSVAFRGHEVDGTPALDIELTDLRVQVTSGSALLIADASSRAFVGTESAGRLVEYDDVVLATLDRNAVALGAGTVSAESAKATLTAAGVPAFGGFYQAGSVLDPVDLDVTIGGAARTAQVTLAIAAEAPRVIGSAMVGEDGVLDATFTVPQNLPIGSYALFVRDADGAVLASDTITVLAAAPGGPGEAPEEPGENPEPSRGTVVVEPDPVARGASATITGSGLEPGTRVGAVIDAAGAPGSLTWGVKESFRSYITGAIAKGDVTTTAPAVADTAGTFTFGDGTGRGDATDATAGFSGTVTFTGHVINGTPALRVAISDPSVVIEDGVGHLVANVTSRALDGSQDVAYPRVTLAALDLSGVTVDEGRLVGTNVPATLTAEGVPAFADFYEAGAALDPISFSVAVEEGVLDVSTLDVPEAVVADDGTVELTWQAPADIAVGQHRVDLVAEGESVADATFGVAAAASPGVDDDGAGDDTTAGGGTRLAQTGTEAAALAALAAAVVLAGAVIATRRQRV